MLEYTELPVGTEPAPRSELEPSMAAITVVFDPKTNAIDVEATNAYNKRLNEIRLG